MRTLDTTNVELLLYFKLFLLCVTAITVLLFVIWRQFRKIFFLEIADRKPRRPVAVPKTDGSDEDDEPPPQKPRLRIVR